MSFRFSFATKYLVTKNKYAAAQNNFASAYEDYALLALTGRYDGISRLEDNRWGFFPGVSVGWNVTREAFWQESKLADVITTLKPRASFGTNGNVNGLGNYEVYGSYGTTTMYNGTTAVVNNGLLNTGLRWEQSKTFEVGLDVGLWNNKLRSFLTTTIVKPKTCLQT